MVCRSSVEVLTYIVITICYVGDALVYVQQQYDQLSIYTQLINSLINEDRVSLCFLLNA